MSGVRRLIKDPFPGLSHWVGVGLSIAATVALLILARGRAWHVVAYSIYGASLILLYLSSAMVHSIHCTQATEDRLDRLDYSAIFLLIAGTYTPLCLVTLRGPWGWSLLGTVWGLAVAGIGSVYLWDGRRSWVRVTLYLCMGWLAVLGIGQLLAVLPWGALAWLLGGGLIYSIGAIIFVTDRPHLWPGRFQAHDLWHVMVLAGSACHFMLVLRFIVPAA